MSRKLQGERASVFFRFPAEDEFNLALNAACTAEFISLSTFGRQAVYNELVRRGYLRGELIGRDGMKRKASKRPDMTGTVIPPEDFILAPDIDVALEQHKEIEPEEPF